MRTHLIGGSTLVMLALALPAQAGSLDAKSIPRDASVVAHVDLDAIRGSSTYRAVDKKMAKEVREARRELASEVKPFDIDLVLDASSITFWGKVGGGDDGAVIVDGVDTRKVLDMMKKIPELKMTRKRGIDVYSVDGEGAIAISGSRVILAEEEANLRLTLATIAGRKPSLKRSRRMPSLAGARGALVVVAMDDRATKAVQKQSQSALLSKGAVSGAMFSVSENGGDLIVTLTVDASDSGVARKLEEAARGGAALLSLATDEPELARLLGSLTVTTKGTSVTAEISADPSSLIDIARQNL